MQPNEAIDRQKQVTKALSCACTHCSRALNLTLKKLQGTTPASLTISTCVSRSSKLVTASTSDPLVSTLRRVPSVKRSFLLASPATVPHSCFTLQLACLLLRPLLKRVPYLVPLTLTAIVQMTQLLRTSLAGPLIPARPRRAIFIWPGPGFPAALLAAGSSMSIASRLRRSICPRGL